MKLNGNFQITGWDEHTTQENDNGSKQSTAVVAQTYTGDLKGNSTIHYVMSYQSPQSAVFVGYETIECTIDNKAGTLVLQHQGKFDNGVASSNSTVVENSGTDACLGITGNGNFTAPMGGTAEYEFILEY